MSLYTENLINLVQSFAIDEVKPVYCQEQFDEDLKPRRAALPKRNEVRRPESKTVTDPLFQTTYEICVRDNELPVIGGYLTSFQHFKYHFNFY